jgi:hypothetical protein
MGPNFYFTPLLTLAFVWNLRETENEKGCLLAGVFSLLVLTGIAVPRSTMAQAARVPLVFFLCGDERSDDPVDFADRINQYTSVSVLAVRPPPTVDVQEARAREK